MKEDWIEVLFKDIVYKISTNKQKLKQKEYLINGEFPVIDQGQKQIGGYTNDKSKVLDCNLPVIVFGDHTKVVKLIHFPFASGADGTKVLQPKKIVYPKLLQYFTKVLVYKIWDKGYARHYQHIEQQKVLIPPLPEQRAIVAKIEQLFSELDTGVAHLKKAQTQLKVYRQAVLKKAFEGALTKTWRAKQTDLPTAEGLLAQIKTERQQHQAQQMAEWEQAVKIWEANGKDGKKPTKPKKIKEVAPLSEEELKALPELPDEWRWINYESLCSKIRNGVSKKPDGNDDDQKIFRISAVRPFKFDLNDFRFIKNDDGKLNEFLLQKGDLLFTRYNGSRKYVGVSALFNSNEAFLYPDKLIQTRLVGNNNPSYYEYATNTFASRKFIESKIRTTAGQSGVSGTDIKAMPVPVCSLPEQNQVVQEIEARLSVCDQVEANIAEGLQKAEALRQSILKKAFEGTLLSPAELQACKNEKDWEPAQALLEKIKEQK